MRKKKNNAKSEPNYFRNADRVGSVPFEIPDSYSQIDPEQLKSFQLPEDAVGYTIATRNATGLIIGYEVPVKSAMSFDNPDELVDFLHENMNESQGIIEVRNGKCKNGGRYVYYILKYCRGGDEIPSRICGYQLNFNFEIGDTVYFISGSFDEAGMTGERDSIGILLLEKAKEQSGQEADLTDIMENEWFCDPYDPEYTKGFLMNRSEIPELDSTFPEHPLSITRALIKYVVENN